MSGQQYDAWERWEKIHDTCQGICKYMIALHGAALLLFMNSIALQKSFDDVIEIFSLFHNNIRCFYIGLIISVFGFSFRVFAHFIKIGLEQSNELSKWRRFRFVKDRILRLKLIRLIYIYYNVQFNFFLLTPFVLVIISFSLFIGGMSLPSLNDWLERGQG